MTENEILQTLDNCHDGYYCSFVELGHVYSYLIDTRLNIFRDENKWAVAVERLGYNPRADAIILDIHYFGNCLINLEYQNEKPTKYYSVYPIENDNFDETVDGECLKANAKFWLVRGQQISLSHNKQDYLDAGIELKEYEPNEISVEEAGRLVILKNRNIFRATDPELYKSIPTELKKILVLDEWFHKDFNIQIFPIMTEEHLKQTFEFNKNLTKNEEMNIDTFITSFRNQEKMNNEYNNEQWNSNRPSSYETWQQIAKVIATNNTDYYKPTIRSNTHWINWPESGSM
jgi:hypothetical protein